MSLSYQIRELIWWQRKLPSEKLYDSSLVVFVHTRFGRSPASFRQTLHHHHHYHHHHHHHHHHHRFQFCHQRIFLQVSAIPVDISWDCSFIRFVDCVTQGPLCVQRVKCLLGIDISIFLTMSVPLHVLTPSSFESVFICFLAHFVNVVMPVFIDWSPKSDFAASVL